MIHDLAVIFLFFLPAGIANATPVFANKIPLVNRWKTPMDFGYSFHGKRLLGNNKTWRGLLTGSVLAGLTGVIIVLVTGSTIPLLSIFILDFIMGIGALSGDAIESFFKRQRGIPSGKSWFPFDQIDYIIGGLLITYPIVRLPFRTMLIIIVMFFGLHLLFAFIGYALKLKDSPI